MASPPSDDAPMETRRRFKVEWSSPMSEMPTRFAEKRVG